MGIGCRRSEQESDVDARVIPKSPWDMKKYRSRTHITFNPFDTG